jgi:cytochrome c oxidase assembly protein subunit 11
MGDRSNLRTLGALCGVAVFMLGMAYAAVPFYDWFCRVTGFAGTVQTAEGEASEVLDRTIKVRFDGSTAEEMPWEFEPVQRVIELRIGETGLAFYRAHNPTDRTITGTATYNVTPYSTGGYFAKIACFCFVEQTLAPGQTVDMPVSFYVDPEIVEDAEAGRVPEITLSYTFYETEESRELAALDDKTGATAN